MSMRVISGGQLVFGNTLHISSIKLVLTITQSGQQQNATVVAVTASLSLGTTVLNFSTDDTSAMLGLNPKTGVTHQDVTFISKYDLLALGLSNTTSLPLSTIFDLVAPAWLTDPSSP
jgi:hypothetical protein